MTNFDKQQPVHTMFAKKNISYQYTLQPVQKSIRHVLFVALFVFFFAGMCDLEVADSQKSSSILVNTSMALHKTNDKPTVGWQDG